MTSRPITWPYGGRFAIIRADPATRTVTIEGKRWPWSRAETVAVQFVDDGTAVFWCDTGTQLTLAPANVFAALMRAAGLR